MTDVVGDLAFQVRRNCRISDARSWGYHSICGLLLRLRELYKWEHGLEPWAKPETKDVLPWIGKREEEWEELGDAKLEPLQIGDEVIDPFDIESVNAVISPLGYFYGAGHGMAMKALFVLGEALDRQCVEGCNAVIVGREIVRDLSPVPAMSRAGLVIARRDAMKWHLWQHLEEQGAKGDTSLAARAFASTGIDLSALVKDPEAHSYIFDRLVEEETANAVRHETGEIREEERSGGRWSRVLGLSCGTKGELLARGLKDVLADTGAGGRMEHIVRQKSIVSLGLFAAFSEGLRRQLFPELSGCFLALLEGCDWEQVDEVRLAAHNRLRTLVDPLLDLLESELPDGEKTRKIDEFEERMFGPGGS